MFITNAFSPSFARAYIFSPCYAEDLNGNQMEDDWLMYLMGADIQ